MEKIEILEKITIYFKDGAGEYTDLIRGNVRDIEIWKATGRGKDVLLKRFKVVEG